jgi:hypothetical protein
MMRTKAPRSGVPPLASVTTPSTTPDDATADCADCSCIAWAGICIAATATAVADTHDLPTPNIDFRMTIPSLIYCYA